MTKVPLLLLLAVPAAANPQAMTATLEALRSEAAADPAALRNRETASARAGKGFDQSFTIQTLTPVEYVQYGEPRKNPPPVIEEKLPPAPSERKLPAAEDAPKTDGTGADYYFEGKKPLNGITIYTPVKGEGSTSEGASPTDKYGKYGKIGIGVGVGLIVAGLLLGGWPLVALGIVGGILIGAGAVLSFLFGKKKK
ncbi:MAG: hypothetical protein HY923_04075 [Elusimicrobia bacterium]|nr:hypothetical protein [Elusimicrobiota bacterium]